MSKSALAPSDGAPARPVFVGEPRACVVFVFAPRDFALLLAATLALQLAGTARGQECIDYRDYVHWVSDVETESYAHDVAAAGGYAFVAGSNPSKFEVIDLSSPASPLVGNVEVPGAAWHVVVAGDFAYVGAGGGGFHVVDIADPRSPAIAGSVTALTSAEGAAVLGPYAYVADSSSGLHVVNISDPTTPEIVGGVDLPGTPREVAVEGQYAYVACREADLQVVDISVPTSPRIVASHEVPGSATDVVVEDGVIYVVDSSYGLELLRINSPSPPTPISSLALPGFAFQVAVAGRLAYVSSGDYLDPREDHYGLEIIDVSDPAAPAIVGSLIDFDVAWGVAVDGDHAYVASGGHVLVADVSNPNRPGATGSIDIPGSIRDLAMEGNVGCVGNGDLVLVDLSDPAVPAISAILDLDNGAIGVAMSGDYAYVVDWLGLAVVDISNPAAPEVAGRVDTPGEAEDVAVAGHYALVADGDRGLQVIDVANPATPVIVGNEPTPARKVVAAGGYACTVTRRLADPRLTVIDISDPAAPFVTGTTNVLDIARGLAMSGSLVYVADRYRGLDIVDISKPTAPTIVGAVNTPDLANAVAVAGGYAYVADYGASPQVVDIADASSPSIIGTRGGTVSRHIAASGSLVVAIDGPSLVVLPVQCSTPSAVELSEFAATPLEDAVLLTWRTSWESHHLGFHVRRSTSVSQVGPRLTPSLIEPPGPYAFRDDDVMPGIVYYYRLEAVDRRGESQFSGAISARVDARAEVEDGSRRTSLAACEPNPFVASAPQVTMRYTLARRGHVTLRVFDAQGRLVRGLVDDIEAAGPHAEHWDGRNDHGQEVGTGMYFYRLDSEAFSESRRLVRIR